MIGIYDSGVGGLHIARAIAKALPNVQLSYLADTRLMPLGAHSEQEIVHALEVACDWFFTTQNCSLVLLACNTASVVGIRHLQQQWLHTWHTGRNILGINIPLLEYMQHEHSALRSKNGIVLSTIATYATQFYELELRKRGFKNVVGYGSSELARNIEYEQIEEVGRELEKMKQWSHDRWGGDPEYIIHACTHFPLIQAAFLNHFPHTQLVDHASFVSRRLVDYLHRHPEYEVGNRGSATYFSSDDPTHLVQRVQSLYGESIAAIGVSLGD